MPVGGRRPPRGRLGGLRRPPPPVRRRRRGGAALRLLNRRRRRGVPPVGRGVRLGRAQLRVRVRAEGACLQAAAAAGGGGGGGRRCHRPQVQRNMRWVKRKPPVLDTFDVAPNSFFNPLMPTRYDCTYGLFYFHGPIVVKS